MEKITSTQFETLKEGLVTTSFEMLDVNGDNVIDENDLSAATDNNIKSDIQKLLDAEDEEPTLSDENLDLDGIENKQEEVKAATVNQVSAVVAATTSGVQMPSGYENVDVSESALSGKTVEELTTMLNKINNNITLITNRMTALQTEYNTLQTDISRLESENASLEARMSGPSESKRLEEANKANAESNLEAGQEDLNLKIGEYEQALQNLAIANNRIRTQEWFEQLDYEHRVKNVSDAAISDYDPEQDGDDFEAYYLRKMATAGCTVFSGLTRLNQQAEVCATEAGTRLKAVIDQTGIVAGLKRTLDDIVSRIAGYDSQLSPLQAQINTNNATIQTKRNLQTTNRTEYNALNTQLTSENAKKTVVQNKIAQISGGGGLSAKDILAQIPQAEKDLAKNNNVDLTKCYAAKGQQDGKWHLYMSNGTSLARKYGQKGSPRGKDLVPNGNGYVRNLKEKEGGQAVYYFTEVNEDMTDGKVDCKYCSYTTCSPLGFDVEGDGINTTTDTVNFDIDGDGEMDIINNSDEWVLAFDKDHNGIAGENGSELFGDNTDIDGDGEADGYKDGFEALKALAKKEGLIGENDSVLNEEDIALLSDKYGLTMTKGYGGEVKSLSELGITQINLAQTDETKLTRNFDGRQNDIMTQEGATFIVNGETRNYADIWHSKKGTVSENTPAKIAQEATTNNSELTLKLNEQGIIALKGKVDYKAIFNRVTRNIGTPSEAEEKIQNYHDKLEKEAEAKEEEKLNEEMKAQEAKDKQIKEQKLKEQKLKEQK